MPSWLKLTTPMLLNSPRPPDKRVSAALRKRRESISKEVRDISWKALQQTDSFHKQWKPRNKAIVALARELAGFLWSLGHVSQLLARDAEYEISNLKSHMRGGLRPGFFKA